MVSGVSILKVYVLRYKLKVLRSKIGTPHVVWFGTINNLLWISWEDQTATISIACLSVHAKPPSGSCSRRIGISADDQVTWSGGSHFDRYVVVLLYDGNHPWI